MSCCRVLLVCLLLGNAAATAEDVTRLNVVIPIFNAAIPEDPAAYEALGVFPQIREVEALLWPFALREQLMQTKKWETVRVVPGDDVLADITVMGTVLGSDGFEFGFHLSVVDAMGRRWLEKDYSGVTTEATSGFQHVFRQAAKDMQVAIAAMAESDRQRVSEISTLRYAARLAPSAFADYLQTQGDGEVSLRRLPAKDDPMLARIQQVRATEFVVEDEIDENYATLSAEVSSVYNLWRDYRRKNVSYQEENMRRAQFDRNDYPQASYERFKRLYDVYKWDRQTSQEQDQLAVAFDNEVSPILEKIELRVAELEVFVDRKNAEWYRLLEELFEVETQLGVD